MKRGSAVISLLMIGLGLFVFFQTLTFPKAFNPNDFGPAFFPRVLSIVLIIFGIGILALTRKEEKEVKYSQLLLIAMSILLSLAYIAAVSYFGFYLSTIVFTALFLIILQVKAKMAATYSVALCLIVYLIFTRLLSMPLPVGILTGTI